MSAEPFTLLAIFVMAAMNYLMRAAGFWIMGHVPLTVPLRRMLEALPGSIVAATVLPIAAKGGVAAVIALAAAVLVMIWRSNSFLGVAAGVGTAALVRAFGL
ncbi:MAG TPA: AzlD domain-containing protein [Xanthobacteraceae bacterium]|nr:AzlD domain-containing protein [Xanthobacteraceae bacterium]